MAKGTAQLQQSCLHTRITTLQTKTLIQTAIAGMATTAMIAMMETAETLIITNIKMATMMVVPTMDFLILAMKVSIMRFLPTMMDTLTTTNIPMEEEHLVYNMNV